MHKAILPALIICIITVALPAYANNDEEIIARSGKWVITSGKGYCSLNYSDPRLAPDDFSFGMGKFINTSTPKKPYKNLYAIGFFYRGWNAPKNSTTEARFYFDDAEQYFTIPLTAQSKDGHSRNQFLMNTRSLNVYLSEINKHDYVAILFPEENGTHFSIPLKGFKRMLPIFYSTCLDEKKTAFRTPPSFPLNLPNTPQQMLI